MRRTEVVKQPCMLQWWEQSKRLLCCSGDESASSSARQETNFVENVTPSPLQRHLSWVLRKEMRVDLCNARRLAARVSESITETCSARLEVGARQRVHCTVRMGPHRRIWRKHAFGTGRRY